MAGHGFNFTQRMHAFCVDIVERMPEYSHVDMNRVAISFTQARKRVTHGIFATTTPMRFEHGRITTVRRGRPYTVQRLYDRRGVEMLYIISFYLPRFLDLNYREKLITVFHELWHINPEFNGDLRRHEGRCYAHSHSQKEYDREMERHVDLYFDRSPTDAAYSFLQRSFEELRAEFGTIRGVKISPPKLIPAPHFD